MTLADLLSASIAEAEARGVTELHVKALQSRRRVILRNAPSTDPAAVDWDFLIEYQRRRRESGARGQTISREYESIRRALKIAKRRGVIDELPREWPPCKKSPKDKQRAGKFRPSELIRRYLEELDGEARDEVMVAMMTGLRSHELKRLRFGWFKPTGAETGAAAILTMPDWSTKSRRERVIGIFPACWEIVERIATERHGGIDEAGSADVFSDSNHNTARRLASRRAGSDTTITLRDCRHFYASEALFASGDPKGTMDALGHKDLSMTSIYTHSTTDRTAAVSAGPAAMVAEVSKGKG